MGRNITALLLPSRLYCRFRNHTESCAGALADFTAGRESHPALKIAVIIAHCGAKSTLFFLRGVWYTREALIKSSAVDGGSFSPNLRFEKLEIHKVFLRFPNLALTKNLSPPTLVD